MRQREQTFDINTYYKYKAITAQKVAKDDGQREENYKKLTNFIGPNITNKELQLNSKDGPISFKPPEYENFSKKYYNNKDKPVKFHEKAKLVNIDVGDITESKVSVDFTTLLAMFDNDDEINEVDREKLLGIDLEQMGSLKDKVGRLIEHLSSFENSEDVVKILDKKIEEIKNLEEDIDNIVFNISKVDKIIYGPEETKVIFKKEN